MSIFIAIFVILVFTWLLKPGILINLYKQTKSLFSSVSFPSSSSSAELTQNKTTVKSFDSIDFFIFFGTQTGTAESFSFCLEKEAQERGYLTKVLSLDQIDKEKLSKSKICVFLVATYGEGDPTENAEAFWDWFRHVSSSFFSQQTKFAVFGLGNSQYEFFNSMSKKLFRKLRTLSCSPICPLGIGDDDGDIEEDFENWKKIFWREMEEKSPPVKNKCVPKQPLSHQVECHFLVDGDPQLKNSQISKFFPENTDKKYIASRIKVVKNVALSKDQLKWEIQFQIVQGDLIDKYHTAQNLSLVPRNDFRLVDRICKRFNWDKRTFFHFSGSNLSRDHKVFTRPMTIEDALLWYIDLTNVPKRFFLSQITEFVRDKNEKKLLNDFLSNRIRRESVFPSFTLWGVLCSLKSLSLSFKTFVLLSPRLLPRDYTISSSPLISPDRISVLYSVVTREKHDFGGYGVCTNYLKTLRSEKDSAVVFLKNIAMSLPPDLKSPVLMIAVGSGIAPFRAFIQEGDRLISLGGQVGEWCLFFGCKSKENDFVYGDELIDSYENGCLRHFFVAFSREKAHKVYVQDLIKKHSLVVWNILKNPLSRIYLCGSTMMGRSVKVALSEAVEENCGATNKKQFASNFMNRLMKEQRVISELWG